MTLSWNEIKSRAVNFSKEWENTANEEADAKPFLDAFFDVFGISRKKVGTFEHRVKKINDADGYIDLLWKGNILIEMKSKGKNLDKAYQQAIEYTQGLKDFELPKYIMVSDFDFIRLYDLEGESVGQSSSIVQKEANNLVGQSSPIVQKDSTNLVGQSSPIVQKDSNNLVGQSSPIVQKDSNNLVGQSSSIVQKEANNLVGQSSSIVQKDSNNLVGQSSSIVQKTISHGQSRTIDLPEKNASAGQSGTIDLPYIQFRLSELVHNVQHFGFMLGYQKKVYKEQDPANIKAAELMGKIYDRLKEIGYEGHPLEVYLVRLLFCLFADDTTIFNKDQFQDYLEYRTNIDGSDLAARLQELFQVLNTPKDKRFKNIDEQLADFPYVNGKLFAEILPNASFDSKMRTALLECCHIDWSKISPAIFGSMFQSVMNPVERRNLGAHYTSEKNIMKLIKPLFLDDLWKEFQTIKGNENKMKEFHRKLGTLKFLDPACGCGNFLIITYRELRLLELEVLRELYKDGQMIADIEQIIWLNVDQFYGIEYEEFPARIAEVAMWLIDHQMNMLISSEFGQYFARLPLSKAANITNGNALRIDWETIIPKNELSFILGNPPFVGKKEQNANQKSDMEFVFSGIKGCGVLDYVTAWYIKAAQYIQDTKIKVAFVSTNSISQGEQVGVLWSILYNQYKIKIHYAHRTFRWSNEAKGNAAVHVVIIGFGNFDVQNKYIYEYEDIKSEPQEIKVKNINPFLVEGKDITLENRKTPICKVPLMNYGSMPIDEGNLILSDEERDNVLKNEPKIINAIRKYMGGDEFINNKKRWCLWLIDFEPTFLKNSKFILDRIEKTKKFRLNSDREATKKLSEKPMLFGEIRQPNSKYIIIPKVSSENRKYIPMGILEPKTIASGSSLVIPLANLYIFGIMTSIMHMVWMKNTCGRMKSDYQYSASIVYNNYPWPLNPSEKQIKAIEEKAQKVLDVRAEFMTPKTPNPKGEMTQVPPLEGFREVGTLKTATTIGEIMEEKGASLADLYDPLTMPPALVKAHNELDKAVDLAYRPQPFTSEAARMEFLFDLYEKYTADLFTKEKVKKGRKK